MLPIPEIQYLAYVHNAIDQLRGEAATLSFFSTGQYVNPMVVRIAGYGYQKGFGGHFHNDNALGGLRDLPGVVVASPARGSDAAAMLRTCAAAAKTDGTVCVFLEPIALYHTRDLHGAGDEGWLSPYVGPDGWAEAHVPIGGGRVARDGTDVLIATWANGLYMSLRVAERLRIEGISCRVLDLRWLVPLPVGDLVANARDVGRVLIVDETRHQGGVGEAVDHGARRAWLRRSDRPQSPPVIRSCRWARRRTSSSSPRTTSPTPCGQSAEIVDAAVTAFERRHRAGAGVPGCSGGHDGRRFSAKAAIPSAASALWKW